MKNTLAAVCAVASLCACGAPETVMKPFAEVQNLQLSLDTTGTDEVHVVVHLSAEVGGGRCFGLPEGTRATVNGAPLEIVERGHGTRSTEGGSGCTSPFFEGSLKDVGEQTEFLIDDGQTTLRAVFKNLGAKRTVLVNGQAEPTNLQGNDVVDLAWLPGSDNLESVRVRMLDANSQVVQSLLTGSSDPILLEQNHIRFLLEVLPAGSYTLSVGATLQAGIEACEGLSQCTAELGRRIDVPVGVQ